MLKKITLQIIIAIACCTAFLLKGFAFDSFSKISMLQENADFSVTLDAQADDIPSSLSIRLKRYQVRTIMIVVKGDFRNFFHIPFKDHPIIKGYSQYRSYEFVINEHYQILGLHLAIHPLEAGDITIPIESELLPKPFMLKIYVEDAKLQPMIDKLGVESYLQKGILKKDVITRLGKPIQKSATFTNGVQVILYNFMEYGIGYQMLFINDRFQEFKRSLHVPIYPSRIKKSPIHEGPSNHTEDENH